MAYTALYRTLRPTCFADILGQEHIVKTLQNQIANDRISHAYLFCGTRGTGKTSTSLVFSKAINCMDLQNFEPCNKCASCTAINTGRGNDILEIDAASNNGVDNIRDIREEVNYPPTISKYKIYIIDEVHMLSTGAFNALLKTLEEPPPHVIFILATTDPQKLPPTILSRCQRYDFKRITPTIMTGAILKFVDTNDKKITVEAIDYISSISDGAMRDALSILDQAFSFYYDEEITLSKILELVGSVDKCIFFELADAIINLDSKSAILTIDKIINMGRDISQFCQDFVKHLRDILVATSIDFESTSLNYAKEHIQKLKTQGESSSKSFIINCINSFAKLQLDLKFSSNQRIALETACIKLCNFDKEHNIDALLLRIEKLEKGIISGGEISVQNEETLEKVQISPSKKIEKAIPDDLKTVKENWSIIIDQIKSPVDKALLKQLEIGYIKGETLYLVSESSTDFYIKKRIVLEQILEEKYAKSFNIEFITTENYNNLHKKEHGVIDEEISKDTQSLLDNISKIGIPIVQE